MAEAGAIATADDPKALEAEFFKALSAANKAAPKAGAVEAFKASLAECKRAGLRPWRDTRDPLEAAQEVMLMKAEKLVSQAVPHLWREQARELRAELGYDCAPALEKALIEHIILCWLRLGEAEIRHSAVTLDNSLKTLNFMDRRLTAAHKRFTRACESLARVRRLSRPNVQVNIAAEGGQQVNVA